MLVLTHTTHLTYLGANSVPASEYVVEVPAQALLCQSALSVPPGAGRVHLFTGDYGRQGPPLRITVNSANGGSTGHKPRGWVQAPTIIPLDRTLAGASDARLCVRNEGAVPFALAGVKNLPSDGSLRLNGRPLGARIQVAWLRPENRRWVELVDEIAPQVGRFKGAAASWWIAAATALALISLVVKGLRTL